MAALSLPTKNQFAFTHTVTPTGDTVITIGHNLFVKSKDAAQWTHQELSAYFAGHSIKTDQEKHDAVLFPIDSIDRHFFTTKGVEVVVSGGLLYYRPYPSQNEWHVTDSASWRTAPELSSASESSQNKRLLISPIAHVALEGNTMFIDSGEHSFEFTLQDAPTTPQSFRCKSCHEKFTTVQMNNASTICSQCGCADYTRLT